MFICKEMDGWMDEEREWKKRMKKGRKEGGREEER